MQAEQVGEVLLADPALLASAMLLSWAIEVLRPIFPVLGLLLVVSLATKLLLSFRRQW